MARACVCDDYFEVDPDNGELCLKKGTMGLRRILYYGDPGTYTFRKSAYPWLARVRVRVQGAGGGSAGANAGTDEAIVRPGGTGGSYGESLIEVSELGAAEMIIVGAGGSAGGAGSDGGDGGVSQFGGHIFAPGGLGGTSNMPSGTTASTAQGIAGPNAGTGDLRAGGGASGSAIRLNGNFGMSGHGGDSEMGTGGLGRTTEGSGLGPRGRGAGAGGGLSFGGDVDGGEGGDGIVVIELYG
jgi:hypothetical protein